MPRITIALDALGAPARRVRVRATEHETGIPWCPMVYVHRDTWEYAVQDWTATDPATRYRLGGGESPEDAVAHAVKRLREAGEARYRDAVAAAKSAKHS